MPLLHEANMDWLYSFVMFSIWSVFPSVVARDTVFVADIRAGKIWKAPLESLEFEEIAVQKVENPVAVDYDPVDHKLYWTDVKLKAIIRAKLDGTQEEIVVPYLEVPDGLSIDVINRHLYWTDTGTDTIERANLDGTNRVVITSENLDEPRAIVVDSQGGRLFWTDWGNNSKIERANLDGSDRVVLVNTDVPVPNGLAVDFEGNRMYWCDAGINRIETADLDGQNRRNLGTFVPLLVGIDIHPFDIGVYNNYLYWSDWSVPQLLKMNKFAGLNAVGAGSRVFQKAGGLHIFKDEANECSSNPCNAGECIDEINFYTCNCTSTGFEGERCEININDCAASPCLNAGICTDLVNAFSCQCTSGFDGDLCQHNTNECISSPCSNNGQCVDLINGFRCDCLQGFTGTRCQEDINECASLPCSNNGQCVDLINGFRCDCLQGFTGTRCQEDINECASSPCSNNGQCVDLINGFRCDCLQGFTGTRCHEDTVDCTPSSCFNGGRCIDLTNEFRCECLPGFTGSRCDEVNQSKPAIWTESPKCVHIGDIDNGYVQRGNDADILVPGSRLKFLCADGYSLVGEKFVYCQTDGTWSTQIPTCVAKSENSYISSSVVYGGGVGGALLIIILIIILIVVCFMKRSKNEHPHLAVHYTNNPQATSDPKDAGDYYSTSLPNPMHYQREPGLRVDIDRPAMPGPRLSNHIYDAIGADGAVGGAGIFPPEHPPSYIDVIGDRKKSEEGAKINEGYLSFEQNDEAKVGSDFLYEKTNEFVTPVYDVPKPAKHN